MYLEKQKLISRSEPHPFRRDLIEFRFNSQSVRQIVEVRLNSHQITKEKNNIRSVIVIVYAITELDPYLFSIEVLLDHPLSL